MNARHILIIFLTLSLAACGTIRHVTHPDREDIKASRLHLVDQFAQHNNFLFRGSDPVLHDKVFAYDELVQLMRTAARAKGVILPDDFYLIDVSLLYVERADKSVEKKYFHDNPYKGEYVNYPVFGHIGGNRFERVIHISDKVVGFLKKFVDYPIFGSLDKLLKYVEKGEQKLTHLDIQAVTGIRGLLTQKRDRAVVVYVHCVAGCDRTGEIIGGYRMQYMRQSLQDVYAQNTRECQREENVFSKDALLAYCRYLGKSDCTI
jgi:hypothetical protein